ncbi:TPA: IS200/IS605 family transposase [Patescibacteria group bacterium]|nr:MAG: Transposase IS200-family protein [Candidatus Gottesmanbacteria bacterium GW2011_GWA2_42_16]HCM37891.1 IS200/IS605 family transposase [Patescibacteria group bacterium]
MYYAKYHVCWCTKYRRRILNPGVAGYVRKILVKIVQSMAGVGIEELGIDDKERDHVHLVIVIPPKYGASDVVAKLKGESASLLRKKFPWLEKVYWKENLVWSPGFFLSTVGVNEKVIKQYVRWQGKQDSGQAQLKLRL